MRLNRFLARAGIASRRAADRIIAAGRVTVNGEIRTVLGQQVDPEHDNVAVDGHPVSLPGRLTYLALNKPAGVVVTLDDPQGRRTVADVVAPLAPGVVPVGRLDAPTKGLLLLTNDGALAHRIAHPSFVIDKVYEVRVSGDVGRDAVALLEEGIELEGRRTAPAVVELVEAGDGASLVRITIHEGRKRQVRRMFEAVGHPVTDLIRTRVGPVELGSLAPGEWRELTPGEVRALASAVNREDEEEA